MDQVRIRASVAAHGLVKGAEITVAATPMVEGAIRSGVFQELERFQAIQPVDDVELPESEEPQPKPKAPRTRGNG